MDGSLWVKLYRWSSVGGALQGAAQLLPLYQLYGQRSVWLSVVTVFHKLKPNEQAKASEQREDASSTVTLVTLNSYMLASFPGHDDMLHVDWE